MPDSRQPRPDPLKTPDGRYLIVRGRLWRATSPDLDEVRREALVQDLMAARRGVAEGRRNSDEQAVKQARSRVDEAKRALGERGPVWWTDGAPDYNRHMVRNTPYSAWFDEVTAGRK